MLYTHRGQMCEVLVIIDKCHAYVHCLRHHLEVTLCKLNVLLQSQSEAGMIQHEHHVYRALYMREVAQFLGIRTSTVRFWEVQGLLQPRRDPISRYRLYNSEQTQQIQIIVLLRNAGCEAHTIQEILVEFAKEGPHPVVTELERLLQDLKQTSYLCTIATASFWSYFLKMQKGKFWLLQIISFFDYPPLIKYL